MFSIIKKLLGITEADEAIQPSLSKQELNKMTKNELEAYALDRFNVDVDKRKRKADLVNQIFELQ